MLDKKRFALTIIDDSLEFAFNHFFFKRKVTYNYKIILNWIN
jgi:hypothetical protein